MPDTRSDRGHAREPRDRNWGELMRRRPIAELTVGVVTPAADGAGREESASVHAAGGDRGHAREPRDRNRREPVRRRPVAELAVEVGTPARDGRVGEERAAVDGTGGDLGN